MAKIKKASWINERANAIAEYKQVKNLLFEQTVRLERFLKDYNQTKEIFVACGKKLEELKIELDDETETDE